MNRAFYVAWLTVLATVATLNGVAFAVDHILDKLVIAVLFLVIICDTISRRADENTIALLRRAWFEHQCLSVDDLFAAREKQWEQR